MNHETKAQKNEKKVEEIKSELSQQELDLISVGPFVYYEGDDADDGK